METNDPNSRMVGGDHYHTGDLKTQHWDMVDDHNIGYLEANASKYLMRYRHKNGLQDLEKAQHYSEKILHNHFHKDRMPRCSIPTLVLDQILVEHDIHGVQRRALEDLLSWRTAGDLSHVINDIEILKKEFLA